MNPVGVAEATNKTGVNLLRPVVHYYVGKAERLEGFEELEMGSETRLIRLIR